MLNNKTFQEFWKNTAADTFEDNQVDAEGIEENTMLLPEEWFRQETSGDDDSKIDSYIDASGNLKL